MIDNVCLGLWSLKLIYQCRTIIYLTLLCGDFESNPGPNLHKLQIFEDYKKHKSNANMYACFVYTIFRSVNKHKEISDILQQQNTQTCLIVTET